MVKIGDKIKVKIGSHKGKILIVHDKGKVIHGNKKLGTKKGSLIYLASPKGTSSKTAFFIRKDFSVIEKGTQLKKKRKK